ncbi:hypothetical protein CASFOL_008110 [Castilleja foliolosa]|uniref:Uncharacterized protein n=1 Tax=Castilleja foliolosa TaxID=1961234 RepID=A0ABD3DYJ9_9LAMI
MGVTMRTGNGAIHGGAYIGSRRRWNNVYVWMVIIAIVFGFGLVLGVMGRNHKRALNLLIEQKHAQLNSLHLLLQKEREHTQEIKAKTDEMRIKMYNLRARNIELNSKISDLHSMISSLRDDQSTVELHFKEKQNEAKLALTEITQQKEAEIEDLKHRLQLCANVESLSKKNKLLIAPTNETAKENIPGIEDDASKTDKENNEYKNDKTVDEEVNKEFATIENGDSGQVSNSSKEIDSRELENQDNSKDEHFRLGRKSGYVRRAKGKRWKTAIDKKRGENDEKTDHKQLQENSREKVENSPPVVKLENSTKAVDTEYTRVKVANGDMSESDDEHINSRGWIKVSGTNEDPEDEDRKDGPEF